MKNPSTEMTDEKINIEIVVMKVLQKVQFKLCSNGEAMGLIYLIDKVMCHKNQMANLLRPNITTSFHFQEENSSLYGIICDLDETVLFRSKYLLWLSGVVSIGSLTYAQLKAQNV